jgi:preprotein translocase subunit SecD
LCRVTLPERTHSMSGNKLSVNFLIILAVVAAAAWYVYPPAESINLGLDLRGGAHILMQVDTESALIYEMELTQSRIGQALKDDGISYDAIVPIGNSGLELRGGDPAKDAEIRKVLKNLVGSWNLDALGDASYRVTMPGAVQGTITTAAIETTLSTLRNRIDQLGVREPTIQKQGMAGDRILIQLPGVEDITEVKDILQDPAVLEWKEVSFPPNALDPGTWNPPTSEAALLALFGGTLPADTEVFPQVTTSVDGVTSVTIYWPLKRVSVVVGNDLKNARRGTDQWGDANIRFELSQDAGRRFSVATKENQGKRMAIVLGGAKTKQVISAPVIRSQIFDQGVIEGGFDVQSAENLALKLRSGALPTAVEIIEERTVGPSLGLDSIKSGVMAAAIGFVGVLLFMVAYYRLSGINAVVALGLNLLLVLGAMVAIGATLTLPGIAGMVLVVGMAVDSNVLIFERVREELRLGKTVRSAVDQGFGRAFVTILDCNVTTLVAAFFLFSYGTGPVKGFAVTLTIGLLASMFTAVFVSRQLFELVLGKGHKVESLSI